VSRNLPVNIHLVENPCVTEVFGICNGLRSANKTQNIKHIQLTIFRIPSYGLYNYAINANNNIYFTLVLFNENNPSVFQELHWTKLCLERGKSSSCKNITQVSLGHIMPPTSPLIVKSVIVSQMQVSGECIIPYSAIS
jgi:hypothetical protein